MLAFTAVWLVLPPVLARLGWPAAQVELVGQVMGQPLWFLGVYLVVVWTLAQQAGFFYADGTLTRLSRRALAGLGAAGLAGLIVLTGPGGYPPSMVGLPGDASNMSPPTLCITAMVALYGPVVAVDGPLPASGTGWWWASRPLLGLRVDPLQTLPTCWSAPTSPARPAPERPAAPIPGC